jgi:transposase
MKIFCGIDWASDHHDIALIDADGTLVARARVSDDATGLQQLLDLLAEHGDTLETRIPAAIETTRGLLVACLRATGRPVYAINPMAAPRYRERHTIARKKSDHLDAMVLANILRTDAAAHRTMPADSELVQAIAVLARAQQDAVWDRTQAANKISVPSARLLPRLPRRRPAGPRWTLLTPRARPAGSGTHPGPSRPTDQDPAARGVEEGRTPTRHRG